MIKMSFRKNKFDVRVFCVSSLWAFNIQYEFVVDIIFSAL